MNPALPEPKCCLVLCGAISLSSRSTACLPAKCGAAPMPSRDRRGVKSIPDAVTDGATPASVTGRTRSISRAESVKAHCKLLVIASLSLGGVGNASHSFLSCAAILPRGSLCGCTPRLKAGGQNRFERRKRPSHPHILAFTDVHIFHRNLPNPLLPTKS
ncbi:hypothetical protein PF005_g14731 [Phytophthora fragariae]|uniref:Uncharacterized protein n=2 Tax=Phytophthora TaxID=4783 RepID=A0A6A3XG88_9STRA|nr:hypothetical protein PF003_g17487 [Phytophthora fragariae]KAE8988707.1 hypothetical protein PR002_g21678 [Phytophthora rubi]KAE8930763.1 hypothetical protein PF009_g19152 [Phytophthora fragariae]KAE8991373.1 hypothetical protein PR001_g21244 [Phytophthora rubi]KAE8993874.1 hypothetical protein PF011_g16961 [Phytophthora fragariae]